MRDGAKIALAGLGVVGVVALGYGVQYYTAEVRGQVAQNERVVADADYRISAYDRFYDDCASAKTLQQNLANAQESVKTETDPTRLAQLQANVAALSNQLNEAVNQYNADARKTDTRGHFLSSDLPYELTTEQEIRCSA